MKEKKSAKPVSFRKKTCYTLAFCAAWLLLYLVLSGYHLTPNQALRSYEDTLLLSAPTQMLMQGKSLSAPDDFVRWRLSENEDCLLFSLYFFRPRMDGWSATGSLLEYQRNTPVEIAIDHSSTYEDYWFGKISDPAVLSMEVRYETAQGEAGSETFWTRKTCCIITALITLLSPHQALPGYGPYPSSYCTPEPAAHKFMILRMFLNNALTGGAP